VDSPNFNVQLLFAIFLQTRWDYPMPQMRATLQKLVERISADRLIWGTDIPIVLLHWTYRQSLDYIRDYCDFLGRKEMDLVLGGNMGRLMGVASEG
jgi:predicted TIM-barrel fold metal-dependent hydrolase